MAAPTYGTASSVVASTTSVAVTCPTTSAGNKLLYFASTNGSAISSTLSGWTYEGEVSGGSPAMREALFSRTATGSEGGTVYTVTGMTSGTKGIGYIIQLVPGTGGDTINLTTRSAVDSDSSSTAVSLTAGSTWVSNTNCIIASSFTGLAPSGTYTSSTTSRTIAQTSASITTTSRFGAGFSSNTGAYGLQTGAVTSGGTGTVSFTATTVGANWSGVGWFVLAESVAATGGSVTAVAATATAAASAPVWRGGGKVTAVAATATALVKPSLGLGQVFSVVATATAAARVPTIDPHVTPSYGSQGSVVAVTSTTAAPPYPAVVAVNDGLLMFVSTNGSAMGAAPAGWAQVGTTQVAGGIRKACFFKRATGSETGTVSVTGLTGGTKGDAYIVRFTRGSSTDVINVTAAGWQDTDAASTTLTGTGASWTSSTAGIIASSYTANAPTTSYSGNATSPTITQAGATVTTTARFAGRTGVAGDNTIAYGFQTGAITAGGTGAPTFTATTAGDNGQGAGFLVLVTETAATNAVVNAVAAPSTAAVAAPVLRQSVRPVATTATASIQPPGASGDSGAPAFRDSGSAQGSSAITSLTVVRPATVQVGDMGIVIVMAGAGSGAASAPATWSTDLANSLTSGGSAGVSVFHRVHQAGDADPTVVWGSAPASGNNTAMLALWFSGATNISINAPTVSGTASASWSTGTLTTAGVDHLVVAIGAMKASSGTWASTASWSPDAQMRATRYATGAFFPSIVAGDFIKTTAGVTNAQTVTWNLSTANAMAFQIDLAGVGTNASVAAVTATATGAAVVPGTGSQVHTFPPAGLGSALVAVPVIFAGTGFSGGGPTDATAIFIAPGVRQRILMNATALATAAMLAPQPPGSSNIAARATASAFAVPPPTVTGSALVAGIVAAATAVTRPPIYSSATTLIRAIATAGALAPSIGQSTVRPGLLVATAAGLAPVVHGVVVAVVATATAGVIAPLGSSDVVLFIPSANAAAIGIDPVVGHKEWIFRTPLHKIHYRTGDPLLDRIGYPTGTAVLLIDGFYINVDYPDDEQIQASTKTYLGGRDYVLSSEELVSLTSAGYGEFINQEVFI